MATKKEEIKKSLDALMKANAALDQAVDAQTNKFILAITEAEGKVYTRAAEIMAGAPDFSALDGSTRMAWYLDHSEDFARVVASKEYFTAVDKYVAAYDDLARHQERIIRAGGVVSKKIPPELIEFIKDRHVRQFGFLNSEAIEELDIMFFNSVVGGETAGATLAGIKGVITGEYPWGTRTGLYEWHATTYARTLNMRAVRTFTKDRADEAGVDTWTYVGPLDSKTRQTCRRWLGRAFTTEEIEQLNNGQTANVMIDGGGWNCRHDWNPISKSLYDTIREETDYTRDLLAA